MKPLKVEAPAGAEVQRVRLYGDPKRQLEPTHFRVIFPGGEVDVARCEDGEYWVHVSINTPEQVAVEDSLKLGYLADARLDIQGKHASETNAGDFAHPGLYHLAVRVGRGERGKRG